MAKEKPKLSFEEYQELKAKEGKKLIKEPYPFLIRVYVAIPIAFFVALLIFYLTYLRSLNN